MQKSLRICYCGHEACSSGHSFGPATRSHYLLHFILKGKGSYHVKDETFFLREGMVFLIHPGEVTLYQADREDPWEYIWIAFEGEDAVSLLKRTFDSRYLNQWKDFDNGISYLWKIYKFYTESGSESLELLGWFYLLFSLFPTLKEDTTDRQDYFKKAEAFIHYSYPYHISVHSISNFIGIDRTYLFRIFKKNAGISPKQYLDNYRILKAKDMLQYTTYSITEIALSCGFNDSSCFCKTFQVKEKMSPKQFRRHC